MDLSAIRVVFKKMHDIIGSRKGGVEVVQGGEGAGWRRDRGVIQ